MNRLLRLVPLGAVLLSACQSMPQSGLVYSSRIVAGVDVSGSATETQGLSLNIGYKTVDFAYVPVAVGTANGEKSRVITGRATDSDDVTPSAPAVGASQPKDGRPAQDTRSDAMSVFGRFDSEAGANKGDKSPNASLTIGRLFATGVAAQRLSEAARAEGRVACMEKVQKVMETAKDKVAVTLADLQKLCGGG